MQIRSHPLRPPLPDILMVDSDSGLILNIPAEYQGENNWWVTDPDLYEGLKALREEYQVNALDFADHRFMESGEGTKLE